MSTLCFARSSLTALAAAAALLSNVTPADAGGSGGGGGGGTASTTGAEEVAGEILVKLRTSDALGALLVKHQLSLVSRFGSRPIFRLKVIGTARVKDKIAALLLEGDVLIAETNLTHRSPEARRNSAWAIGTAQAYAAQWAPQAMRLADAQDRANGSGVRVAVLDTGVDTNHPALAGRLLPGFDFVDNDPDPSEMGSTAQLGYGHGTHVAGLIAMVAPAAKIMPLRVLDADGQGNAWVLAEALLYAVDPDGNPSSDDGAHVINMSLGSLSRTRLFNTIAQIVTCQPAVVPTAIDDISDAGFDADRARCAAGNGAVVVAAAGNDASSGVKEYPAAENAYGLMAVAASDARLRLASFSNFGSWVHLAAPGNNITSSVPGGGWGTWSGTSMAAPLVAGTAALVRSQDLGLSPVNVVRRITRNTTNLCGTNMRQLDAAGAVRNQTLAERPCP